MIFKEIVYFKIMSLIIKIIINSKTSFFSQF